MLKQKNPKKAKENHHPRKRFKQGGPRAGWSNQTETDLELSVKSEPKVTETLLAYLKRSQTHLQCAVSNALVDLGLVDSTVDRSDTDWTTGSEIELVRSWRRLSAKNREHAREVRSALDRAAAAYARTSRLLKPHRATPNTVAGVTEIYLAADDNWFAADVLERTAWWYSARHPELDNVAS
jgi:hypothetical protein